MYIDIATRMFKYFDLLQDEKPNSLLRLTLCPEKELWEDGVDGWYGAVMNIKQCLMPTQRDLPSNWDWVSALERGYDESWYKDLWSGNTGTKTLDKYRFSPRTVRTHVQYAPPYFT